jgi:hypothetical protein
MQKKFRFWLAKLIAPIIIKWNGNLFHFEKAIREAERITRNKNGVAGKRHYIYFIGGKYRILQRKQVQHLRNQRVLKNNISVSRMTGVQLYDTMGHINSHPTYKQVSVRGINIQYSRAKDLVAIKKSK